MKYLVLLILIVLICLSSCQEDQVTPPPTEHKEVSAVSTSSSTSTLSSVETSSIATTPSNPTVTSVSNSTPLMPFVTPSPLRPPVTLIPTEESVSNLQIKCGQIFSDVNEIAAPSVEGIVLKNEWNGQDAVGVLGPNGVESPAFIWSVAEESFNTYISPDGHWLAYFDYNFDASPAIVTIFVLNPITQQLIQTQIAHERLGGLSSGWLNSSQLIVGFANEGDQFSHMIWSPFNGETELVSVDLTGYGFPDAVRFPIWPVFDPLSELVIYPCYASNCTGDVYRVKELNSGEIFWSMSFGEDYLGDNREIAWSPDGQLIVVIKNDRFRNPLIFNRAGELLHEIYLPEPDRLGGTYHFSWSPDSQYLAFIRGSTDAEGNPRQTLFYYRLADESLVDLCVEPSLGSVLLEWSPDSTRIAYGVHTNPLADFDEFILQGYTIDVFSGDAVKFYETDEHNMLFLVGWAVTTNTVD